MDRSFDKRAVRGLLLLAAAALLWSGSGAALAVTVEVTDTELGVTRACGSPFDAISGRSGWETWWARDLDELDTTVRERVLRTAQCPDAVNRATVAATTLGGLGVLAALAAGLTLRRPSSARRSPIRRLTRLGWLTAASGGVLTVAGLAATAVLLADPEAPLFLYTSRSVAAAVALIVLTPALALIAGGGALVLVAGVLAGGGDDDDQ